MRLQSLCNEEGIIDRSRQSEGFARVVAPNAQSSLHHAVTEASFSHRLFRRRKAHRKCALCHHLPHQGALRALLHPQLWTVLARPQTCKVALRMVFARFSFLRVSAAVQKWQCSHAFPLRHPSALRVKNRHGRHSPRRCLSICEGPSPGFTHLGKHGEELLRDSDS